MTKPLSKCTRNFLLAVARRMPQAIANRIRKYTDKRTPRRGPRKVKVAA